MKQIAFIIFFLLHNIVVLPKPTYNSLDNALITASKECPTEKNLDIIAKLLKNQANPNTATIKGTTPLMFAAMGCYDHKKAQNFFTSDYPEHAQNAHKRIKMLLNAGAHKSKKNDQELGAFECWVLWGPHEPLIGFALADSASINQKNKHGKTALMYAVNPVKSEPNELKITALLQMGADASVTDYHNNSVLHYFAQNLFITEKHQKIIDFLLKQFPFSKIQLKNNDGKLPSMLAQDFLVKRMLEKVENTIHNHGITLESDNVQTSNHFAVPVSLITAMVIGAVFMLKEFNKLSISMERDRAQLRQLAAERRQLQESINAQRAQFILQLVFNNIAGQLQNQLRQDIQQGIPAIIADNGALPAA